MTAYNLLINVKPLSLSNNLEHLPRGSFSHHPVLGSLWSNSFPLICYRLHKGLDYSGDYFCIISIFTSSIFKGGWVLAGGEYPDENALLSFVAMSEKTCKTSDLLGQ